MKYICVNLQAVWNVFHWVFLVCFYIAALGMGLVDQQLKKLPFANPATPLFEQTSLNGDL